MLLDRQIFTYHNKTIIEKATFATPYRHEGVFQNEGCFLYIKGKGTKVLSSDDNISAKSKEAVLLKCGTYFLDMVKNAEDDKMEVIAFHLFPDILKDLFANELPALIERNTRKPETRQIIPDDTIAKFVESLEFYFENPALVNEDLLGLKIKELILLLVQTKNVGSILELMSDLYSTRTVSIKKVIDLHIYSNLTIEELAKLCNLSLSSFKREFKKVFDDSPANYILSAKIKKAKELLAISDLPINEIAYETGFNDPLYFTRQFKKKVGNSPSVYRKENT
jgi:AraC-like DNA-binding protein